LGLLQYAQDYDEKQPKVAFGGLGASNWPTTYKWMDAIYPYVKSEQVFRCPSDLGTALGFYKYAGRTPGVDSFNFSSYIYNNAYWGYPALSPSAKNLSAIEAPATTAWILEQTDGSNIEASWQNEAANPVIGTYSAGYKMLPTASGDIAERHLGTTVVLYCDGHVKSVRLDNLAATKPVLVQQTGLTVPLMTAFTIQDD
jgi:prepilin-type processing-associated H-X9-DG protein